MKTSKLLLALLLSAAALSANAACRYEVHKTGKIYTNCMPQNDEEMAQMINPTGASPGSRIPSSMIEEKYEGIPESKAPNRIVKDSSLPE